MDTIALTAIENIINGIGSVYDEAIAVLAIVGVVLSVMSKNGMIYSIIGLFFTRKFKPAQNLHKYAILIPARNESAVIANLISSIKKQDYPQELITIFVVADNCTDNTAEIARNNGAICYERQNPNERTKGFALRFLFENIKKDYGIEFFDGYFIFDADNLLKKDYVSRMNDSFDSGEKIITSYRNTKNFSESWIASTYALHWIRSIRQWHRARSFLHLATNIQGTGFLFANEIVKDGWKYTSLTEDRALTADCVVAGYEISYNDKAVFYDEQPNDLKVALRQRTRWAKGHLQAFGESGWGLFSHIFIDKRNKPKEFEHWYEFLWATIRYRWMSYDTFAQLLPKNIVSIVRFILDQLIFYPCLCYSIGFAVRGADFYGSTKIGLELFGIKFFEGIGIGDILIFIFGEVPIKASPGIQAYLACFLIAIWWRLLYRIARYFVNILIAVYLFIIERKRIMKISIWKKILYCFTWPIFDIIGRYAQYVALFIKVEWKPIPHNSKVTIEDIKHE